MLPNITRNWYGNESSLCIVLTSVSIFENHKNAFVSPWRLEKLGQLKKLKQKPRNKQSEKNVGILSKSVDAFFIQILSYFIKLLDTNS